MGAARAVWKGRELVYEVQGKTSACDWILALRKVSRCQGFERRMSSSWWGKKTSFTVGLPCCRGVGRRVWSREVTGWDRCLRAVAGKSLAGLRKQGSNSKEIPGEVLDKIFVTGSWASYLSHPSAETTGLCYATQLSWHFLFALFRMRPRPSGF